jgi:copper(I)-binding protein
VGYLVIDNHGRNADALVGVETPIAARVDMHAMSMAGGVMRMQKVASVALPPGGEAVFGPNGGYHLMLMGLTKPLNVGDKVPATLTFRSGARLKVAFSVSVMPPSM